MINVSVFSESEIIRHGIKNLISKIPNIRVTTNKGHKLDSFTVKNDNIPHLYIVDYKLPKLDLNRLSEYKCFNCTSCCGLLVLVPNNISDDELLELLYYGAKGYIKETCDKETIHSAIKKVSEGGIWVESRILESLLQNGIPRIYNKRNDNKFSFELLTKREKEVAQMIIEENSNKAIAKKLYLTESTVKTHISNIFRKLGIKNRHDLFEQYKQRK